MLRDIEKRYSIIHIAGREYRIRYSLNCLSYLEHEHKPLTEIISVRPEDWTIEDVLRLTHAAMCSMPWNRRAVNRREYDRIKPTIAELGELIQPQDFPLLKTEIINAIVDSMPENRGSTSEPQPVRESIVRAMYVDVIGRPEPEFWNSTYREIVDRTDAYMEAKGLKEPPQTVKMLDD